VLCVTRENITLRPCFIWALWLVSFFSDITGTPLLSPDIDLKTNITSAQNVSVTFQFKSTAYPEPTFEWCKYVDSYCKTLNSDKKFEISTHGLNSSLSIRDITEDDYGRYKLKINNTVGSLEQIYLLKANGKYEKCYYWIWISWSPYIVMKLEYSHSWNPLHRTAFMPFERYLDTNISE
jgi:hypothetical protein